MRPDHLRILKDYVECRISAEEWRSWLAAHVDEVESDSGRGVRLRLQHRGFGGVQAILEGLGISFQVPEGRCLSCGALMFEAIPGVTTPDEIKAFANSSQLRGKEQIARDGWIHPGRHCPNGCTVVLQEIK